MKGLEVLFGGHKYAREASLNIESVWKGGIVILKVPRR